MNLDRRDGVTAPWAFEAVGVLPIATQLPDSELLVQRQSRNS